MKIGVLGAGQLGRMLALAGYPLELDFHFFDTSGHPSAGLGHVTIDQNGSNNRLIEQFLSDVDLVTYEFENLPLKLTQKIEQTKPLYPSSESIRVGQNRAKEKALFTQLGIPTAEYRLANSEEELASATRELGYPVVAKSVTEGYDGKGQYVIKGPADIKVAWDSIKHPHLMVESFVIFRRELSIIAVRSASKELAFYPLAENIHSEGILRYSTAPAPRLTEAMELQARRYVGLTMDQLDHVGVLTLELFDSEQGLLANEMAPRVHNSGHWSIEGANCSQFENHLRAISDMPLGDTTAALPACMINIIGHKGNIREIMKLPYAHIHLYGKEERQGRKLGHITVIAEDYETLQTRVKTIADLLPDCPEYNCSE
jgi:5-(carboxyamino)imidazole ribonucleotide synthase